MRLTERENERTRVRENARRDAATEGRKDGRTEREESVEREGEREREKEARARGTHRSRAAACCAGERAPTAAAGVRCSGRAAATYAIREARACVHTTFNT